MFSFGNIDTKCLIFFAILLKTYFYITDGIARRKLLALGATIPGILLFSNTPISCE